jgi:hypothetical protein
MPAAGMSIAEKQEESQMWVRIRILIDEQEIRLNDICNRLNQLEKTCNGLVKMIDN